MLDPADELFRMLVGEHVAEDTARDGTAADGSTRGGTADEPTRDDAPRLSEARVRLARCSVGVLEQWAVSCALVRHEPVEMTCHVRIASLNH